MTDMKLFDETKPLAEDSAAPPPLCLVHYFGAETGHPPERSLKPPGNAPVGRIAERHGNLIVLEFASPRSERAKAGSKKPPAKIADALFLLLLLVCITGCVAAFRF